MGKLLDVALSRRMSRVRSPLTSAVSVPTASSASTTARMVEEAAERAEEARHYANLAHADRG
jgi:uncharacterized iron-regulated protein